MKNNYKDYARPLLKKIGWVIVGMLIAIIIGAMVGYHLADGGNPFAIFNPQTWQHVIDFTR
ncbi:hypothetical protein IV38_GL000200 [Lactobacillus selangorensis]|uniref:DNA-directed RNA polymerase subunit beta n=1 Tax=Lactobacillus selangorensis TaxID=81857 RepID=A0A0R2GA44_9LACO|nr:DNA-directed RNA polymerase subunit beta [Lactobacillus selangorensis]KRN29317.1 hypothetical protein IV38_GL000200 [Lactobacillus selangorensis]KRN34154.1 hypothetical protein IV40_GL000469 [Lactobacillus selangorensis]